MNVIEAIEGITTIMEAMQQHRKRQDERIRFLERRAAIHNAVGLFISVVVLLAVIFLS